MLGHASAAMTLDVYSGLFDDDLTDWPTGWTLPRAAAQDRMGAVWARPPSERPEKGKKPAQTGGPVGIEPTTGDA